MPFIASRPPTTRAEARRLIVQRANIHRVNCARRRWCWRSATTPTLLSNRQVQQAVFTCRQNDLVEDEILELAGYRSRRSTSASATSAAALAAA